MYGENETDRREAKWYICGILAVCLTIVGVVIYMGYRVTPTPQTPIQQFTTPTAVVPEPKNVQVSPVLPDWSAKLPDGTTVYRIQDKEMNRVCYVTGNAIQMQCGAVSLTITAPTGSTTE